MGCKLPKLKRSEENSPGKIYSTLKRPQVETKVGVAYTYRFLDFILGKDDGTSMLCISSVRELPAQMLDLYRQGFVLAAVHPFVQPLGIEPTTARRLLYRAVLVRLSESGEKSETKCDNHLEMEMCLSADQVPSTELIQGYLKKIQDAAEQGIMFVGFVQQPSRALCALGRADPDEISLSLHSSPSSIQGDKVDQSVDARQQSPSEERHLQVKGSACELAEVVQEDGEVQAGDRAEERGESTPSSPSDATSPAHVGSPEVTAGDILAGNNNKAAVQEAKKEEHNRPATPSNGLELFALFNRPGTGPSLLKYYTVKVPLRVQFRDEGVSSVEASWLDHMTQHFNSGASLVDGYFHLGHENDSAPRSVDSIFIFQEGQDVDSSTSPAYDAIVVEQWTVIQGVSVKTDYIPLLQSLAMYGWRLTCVLPTPVVKTNSDGSLATKQIVFLQRPVLPRKKKEPKRLNFKTRSKSNKNSVKDVPKDRRQKGDTLGTEKETEEQKALEGEESACRGETDGADRKRGSGGGRAPDTEEGHREDPREVENGERGDGGAREDCYEEGREGSETAVGRGRGGEVEPEEAGEHREPKLATAGVTDRDAVAETTEDETEAGQQRLAGAQDDVGKDQGQQQEGECGNGRRPPASGHGGRERSGGDGGDAEIVVQVSMETARVQEALSS